MFGNNLHVLIAEDDPIIVNIFMEFFKKKGILNIYTASTGRTAVKKFTQHPINCIICDWNMPLMTGFDVLQTVRSQHGRYPDVPFIMVTQVNYEKEVKEAIINRVDDYIVKPFKLTDVEKRFENVLLSKLPEEFVNLAINDLITNNYDNAYRKLTKALNVLPEYKNIAYALLPVYVHQNDQISASQFFKTIANDPPTALWHYACGFYQMYIKNFSDAYAHFLSCADKLEVPFEKLKLLQLECLINEKNDDNALKLLELIDRSSLPCLEDKKKVDEYHKRFHRSDRSSS
ncbi:MAG: response regulator [Oligoflexia bacterium]|nr:response regulator [Oligoflexia bacterium]MBF0366520.1 response regulator [Oligoflexia bacterium]